MTGQLELISFQRINKETVHGLKRSKLHFLSSKKTQTSNFRRKMIRFHFVSCESWEVSSIARSRGFSVSKPETPSVFFRVRAWTEKNASRFPFPAVFRPVGTLSGFVPFFRLKWDETICPCEHYLDSFCPWEHRGKTDGLKKTRLVFFRRRQV